MTTVSAEKAGMTRERDEGRAELAKLQAKLQASALQVGRPVIFCCQASG